MPVMEEQSSPRREYPETFEENRQRNSKEDNEETHTILRRRMTAGSPSRARASFFNLITAIATGSEAGSPNYGKQRRGSYESSPFALERILCTGRGERLARFGGRRGAGKAPSTSLLPCAAGGWNRMGMSPSRDGGTGRRSGLKIRRPLRSWGFDPPSRHQ